MVEHQSEFNPTMTVLRWLPLAIGVAFAAWGFWLLYEHHDVGDYRERAHAQGIGFMLAGCFCAIVQIIVIIKKKQIDR